MTPAAPLTHSSHLTSLRVNSFVIQSAGDIAALPDTSGSSLQTFFSGEGNDGGCKVPAAPVLVCLSTSAHKWVPAANGLWCYANQGREGPFSSGQRVPGGAQSLTLQRGDDDTAVPCVPNTRPCQICPGLFAWLKVRGHCDTSFTRSVRIMGFLPSCVLSCAGSQVPAVITHTWTQGSGRQDQVRLSPSQTQPEEVSSLVCSQKRFQDPWRLSQVGPHVGSLGYVYTKKGCFISRGASVYKCPQPLSSWQTKVWAYF